MIEQFFKRFDSLVETMQRLEGIGIQVSGSDLASLSKTPTLVHIERITRPE